MIDVFYFARSTPAFVIRRINDAILENPDALRRIMQKY